MAWHWQPQHARRKRPHRLLTKLLLLLKAAPPLVAPLLLKAVPLPPKVVPLLVALLLVALPLAAPLLTALLLQNNQNKRYSERAGGNSVAAGRFFL